MDKNKFIKGEAVTIPVICIQRDLVTGKTVSLRGKYGTFLRYEGFGKKTRAIIKIEEIEYNVPLSVLERVKA